MKVDYLTKPLAESGRIAITRTRTGRGKWACRLTRAYRFEVPVPELEEYTLPQARGAMQRELAKMLRADAEHLDPQMAHPWVVSKLLDFIDMALKYEPDTSNRETFEDMADGERYRSEYLGEALFSVKNILEGREITHDMERLLRYAQEDEELE